MRILHVDVDSLRPDHLGCYGYHRDTSPNIDRIARDALVFEQCYASDTPCLPSRTAMWSGRTGFHTGVVGHGGSAAVPFGEGAARREQDLLSTTGWMSVLRGAGLRTASISSFGERHSAWHWYAGFTEIYNPGMRGMESAHDVNLLARDWLRRNAASDDWYLHVNYWDPHTPYRVPDDDGDPFAGEPLPAWLNDEVRARLWDGHGPHSAREPRGWDDEGGDRGPWPRMPCEIDSMQALREWIDAYDAGVRYADEHIGALFEELDRAGVLDESVLIITGDHGENLGELNIWGDHQTADLITCRIPMIVRWPGVPARIDRALHYHFDVVATLLELAGAEVPAIWDARPFAGAVRSGNEDGRNYLVCGQGAWSCQRAVRFDRYMCIRTYHDGFKDLRPVMLFDAIDDAHEQRDLAAERPAVVDHSMHLLSDWHAGMVASAPAAVDPLVTVIREGGPLYTQGMLPEYLSRLRATGRERHARALAERHG
ncbi:MAG: sulfatase [Actinomycetota bacterium]